MNTYKFAVSLCGGWCDGKLVIEADNEDDAYEKAMDYVVVRLLDAFPNFGIDFDVELIESTEDPTEEEQELEVCPVCGAQIEPKDGEDNGYGELHLYWTCESCSSRGKAIIDLHNDNAFIEHEISEHGEGYDA